MKKLLSLALALIMVIGCFGLATAEGERVLKVGVTSMSAQFDPGYSIGTQTIKIFYNIYDTLLTTDKEGKIAGQLAEKVFHHLFPESIVEPESVYHFHLKQSS